MQGWRRFMEDSHSIELMEEAAPGIYAVFDGHGGREVALFCSNYFVRELKSLPSFKEGNYQEAIRQTFHKIDQLLTDENYIEELEALRHPEEIKTESEELHSDSHAVKKLFSIAKQFSNFSKNNEVEQLENQIRSPQSTVETLEPQTASELLENGIILDKNENLKRFYTPEGPHPSNANTLDLAAEESTHTEKFSCVDNEKVCNLPEHRVKAGCTAVVALVDDNHVTVGWAGDSRAVICKNGVAFALTRDHKPDHLEERARIQKAGGFVENICGQYRANGNLNLSRAIGDLKYKQNKSLGLAEQIITAEPELSVVRRERDHEFLIIACDGVWDVLSNQEACDFVRSRLQGNQTPTVEKIVEELLDRCVSSSPTLSKGVGCDNMTCVILFFKK
ncbi:probable protein phosphatase 2C 3 [Zophobas morio]|uniref:probable protein phosphatase 2C 3 n=1 Tax=Zophobas morio TaxID=2755281 RepID=UPI003082BC34